MLSRNAMWSIAGSALPALSALASIPILLILLDYRLFSVASLLLSIAIFFFVYDFGIGRTVTYFSSKTPAENTQERDALLGQALLWSLLIGVFSVVIVVGFSDLFVDKWLNTTIEHRDETALAFKIAAWGIPASILAHLLRGVLEGRQDFRAANICKMISGASLFILPLIVVTIGHTTLVDISCAISISRYLALFAYVYIAGRFMHFTKTGMAMDFSSPFLKYGMWTAVAGFISSMFVYGDRFVVAGYLSPEALSAYIASQDILIRYLLVPWAMSTVLLPQLTQTVHVTRSAAAIYRGHQAKIRWLSSAFLLLVITVVWGLVPAVDAGLLSADARAIISIQAVGIFFCALAQLPLIYLYASGRPRLVAAIFVFELIVYVSIAPLVFERYTGVGASVVWSARLFLEYLLLSYWVRSSMK